jgi:hypothetical protein
MLYGWADGPDSTHLFDAVNHEKDAHAPAVDRIPVGDRPGWL